MSERPGTGELVAGIAGFVLLMSMFIFGWFGLEGFTGDAFDALDDWVNIILVFTAFAGMALMLFGPDIPRVDVVPLGTATLFLGAVSVLVVLIHIIAPPGVSAGAVSVDLDPEFGVWIGLISSAAVAIGGYMTVQEEGAFSSPPPAQQSPPPPAQQSPPPPGPPPS